MAVTLTGGTGLFDRIGALGYFINTCNGRRGGSSSGDYPKEMNDALALFDGSSNALRACVADLLDRGLGAIQSGHTGGMAVVKTAAQNTLVEMFDADNPLPERSVAWAMIRLIRQMRTATTRYVAANTITATVTNTGNTGTGNIVTCIYDGLGYVLENMHAQDFVVSVVDDSTSGSEQLLIQGEPSEDDRLSWLFPAGTGDSIQYTAFDAALTDNIITNGDMEDFTVANTPDSWTIDAGSAGTQVLSEASTVYKGSKALELVGHATGAALSTSIVASVSSRTNYAINFWAKVDVVPAAGVLTVDLYDGSGVINDEAGTAQSTTYTLSGLTTSYVAKSFCFRLPEPLPAAVRVRFRLTTALSVGSSLFIDHIGCTEMTQPNSAIPGATPYIAIFSGAVDYALDDGIGAKVLEIVAANDYSGAWQQLFNRLFDMEDLGLILPTSGTTVVDPALIA